MDFHALQQKLFQIEPTDRADDLAKLRAQANDSVPQQSVEAPQNMVQESVEVPEGSMQLDKDYSVSDFAKLAGVTLNEGKQKHGSAGQLKGKDAFTKSSKPGGNETPHPARNKLVGDSIDNDVEEGALDGFRTGYQAMQKGGALGPDALEKGISDIFTGKVDKKEKGKDKKEKSATSKFDQSIQKILKDPALKKELLALIQKANSKKMMNSEAKKNKKPVIKSRDPNWRDLEALRKSGAGGSHQDKTKILPRKQKYKSDPTQESIKEMLYRKLNEKSS